MPYYRVRNKRRQIAAELSEEGLSVHDQKLSWQLQRLREAGETPFAPADASGGRPWNLSSLLHFLEENGYTVERKDP